MASEVPDGLLIELDKLYMAVAQARIAGDSDLSARTYAELERFCRAQTVVTGSAVFLCGLAVLTENDEAAITAFHEAISIARSRGERVYDILFPLAVRHYQRDELDLAKKYASESREEALKAEDFEAAEEVAVMLNNIAERGA